ncbi:c-type cytochrome [Pararhizobium haloflavum]|uniref:c-type cytochrome n=1 Tax=Pararhizobium haloflavum TaxID=2037914 RepID=UPI000C17ABED|nr:c-type cytochrome [Pararhizobium haloflavum]
MALHSIHSNPSPGKAARLAAIPGFFFLLAVPALADQESDGFVERVLAVDANAAYGEYLSSQCTACHGRSESQIPVIRGLPAEYFVEALHEYQTGKRDNDVMKSQVGSLSEEEIAALAAYFANQEPQ